MSKRHVVFSQRQGEAPWDRRLSALAEAARAEGYGTEFVDLYGLDTPKEQTARLVEACTELQGDLVLVGTGFGAHVTVTSASLLHARGVFLMSPALYVEGLPELRPGALDCPTVVVHGWRDEMVPHEHSVRFAREYRAALHLLDGDHTLQNQVRLLRHLFEFYLIALDLPPGAFE